MPPSERDRRFLEALLELDPVRDARVILDLHERFHSGAETFELPDSSGDGGEGAQAEVGLQEDEIAAGSDGGYLLQRRALESELEELRLGLLVQDPQGVLDRLSSLEARMPEHPDLLMQARRLREVIGIRAELLALRDDSRLDRDFVETLIESTGLPSRERSHRRAVFERKMLTRGSGTLFHRTKKSIVRLRRKHRAVAELEKEWVNRIDCLELRGNTPGALRRDQSSPRVNPYVAAAVIACVVIYYIYKLVSTWLM